ncbi:unnamed protein product, partial [Meganyctiphanes norvegica]
MDPGKIIQIITNSTLLATRLLQGPRPLEFSAPRYCIQVIEDARPSTAVTDVTAHHTEGLTVRYSITGGNRDGVFTIDNRTGLISLAGPLDHELNKKHELVVTAEAGVDEAHSIVEVTVVDVNDNPPAFINSDTEISVQEEEDRGLPKLLRKIEAEDPDEVDAGGLVYRLTGAAGDPTGLVYKYFMVNATTGELYLLKALDRDPPIGRAVWRLRVQVRDGSKENQDGSENTEIEELLTSDELPLMDYLVAAAPDPLPVEEKKHHRRTGATGRVSRNANHDYIAATPTVNNGIANHRKYKKRLKFSTRKEEINSKNNFVNNNEVIHPRVSNLQTNTAYEGYIKYVNVNNRYFPANTDTSATYKWIIDKTPHYIYRYNSSDHHLYKFYKKKNYNSKNSNKKTNKIQDWIAGDLNPKHPIGSNSNIRGEIYKPSNVISAAQGYWNGEHMFTATSRGERNSKPKGDNKTKSNLINLTQLREKHNKLDNKGRLAVNKTYTIGPISSSPTNNKLLSTRITHRKQRGKREATRENNNSDNDYQDNYSSMHDMDYHTMHIDEGGCRDYGF